MRKNLFASTKILFLYVVLLSGIVQGQERGALQKRDICFHRYLHSIRNTYLAALFPNHTENWHLPRIEPISDRVLLIDYGPGTTATHGICIDLARIKKTTLHWKSCYGPRCREARPAQLLWASVVKNSHNMTTSDWIDFMKRLDPLLNPVDGLADSPLSRLSWLLPQLYPNSIAVWTDREPKEWVDSRKEHHMMTTVEYLQLRPTQHKFTVKESSNSDLTEGFLALREFLICSVPQEELLILDYFSEREKRASSGKEVSFSNELEKFFQRAKSRKKLQVDQQNLY